MANPAMQQIPEAMGSSTHHNSWLLALSSTDSTLSGFTGIAVFAVFAVTGTGPLVVAVVGSVDGASVGEAVGSYDGSYVGDGADVGS